MSANVPEAPKAESTAQVSSTAQAPERWWHRHRIPVGLVSAAVASGLAVTWLVVVPSEATEASGLQRWVLQYAHSICWALLALAAGLFAARGPRRLFDGLAWAGLVSYAAFLLALWA